MYIIIFLLAIFADQVTKTLAKSYLMGQVQVKILKNWLHLTYLENKGAAWGMLQNAKYIFIIIAFAVCLAILVFLLKNRNKIGISVKLPLVMIMAGAIGNVIDRFRFGYVVDFIFTPLGGIYDFPVFNFADMYISFSAIFLIFYIFFIEGKNDKDRK
ncbi:signal peptidase II [Peptoniphilaceae bacterium SGI.131]